jgi:hypothetical protein
MSEITVDQLIKFFIGAFVVVIVVAGIYFFFKNYAIDFFNNISGGNSSKINFVLSILK